jgi:hypothetical protein
VNAYINTLKERRNYIMNKINIGAMVIAIGMALGSNAHAQNITADEYKLQGKTIDAQFKADKEACGSLAGNAKDICTEKAKARQKLAEAELEFNYKPTAKNRNGVAEAKAEGDYNVAKEVCDDKSGNDKDVCVKEAKAAKTRTLADAKARLEDTKAGAAALDKSIEAHSEANSDKADADFAVAKEKCDTFAGNAKDRCLNDAKARFGKN